MKEYKIVDRYTWENMKRIVRMNIPMNEDDIGWIVDQVIAKPITRIEYEYVLVRPLKVGTKQEGV